MGLLLSPKRCDSRLGVVPGRERPSPAALPSPLFSLFFDVDDSYEDLRLRDTRRLSREGVSCGLSEGRTTGASGSKVGGKMSSWVLVSVRMKVNSGVGGSETWLLWDGTAAEALVILSFFFRRSFSAIVR